MCRPVEVEVETGGGPDGALADAGTLHGCVAVRGRPVEEVEMGMGGGLGVALADGGTQRGIPARWRRIERIGKSGYKQVEYSAVKSSEQVGPPDQLSTWG